MKIEKKEYVVGDIFIATEGAYSDYGIIGTFKVTKAFNLDDYALPVSKGYTSRDYDWSAMVKACLFEDMDVPIIWIESW